MNSYVALFLAIICELAGTSSLKKSESFTRPVPTLIVIIGIGSAFYFISLAVQTIPVGLVYAIWSGVGIVFLTIIGAVLYKQVPDMPAKIGLTLIVTGVVVINLLSATATH